MTLEQDPGVASEGDVGLGRGGAPSSLPTLEPLRANARIFSRREEKYELGLRAAHRLEGEISRRLPRFSYCPGQPCTYITTVYFDTRSRDLYRRAELDYEDNVKIRVREYYYPRAEDAASTGSGAVLRAHATAGSEALTSAKPRGNGDRAASSTFLTQDHCFVELKQRIRGTVLKKRFALPKADLVRLFRGDDLWPVLVRANPPSEMGALQESYDALLSYLKRFPVEVTSIVNYRRTVYQEDERDLRVTFDDALAIYPPFRGLYSAVDALTTDVLGPAIRQSDRVILEIKCPGRYPDWLQEALRSQCSKRLSKFTTSVRLLIRDRAQAEDRRATRYTGDGASDGESASGDSAGGGLGVPETLS